MVQTHLRKHVPHADSLGKLAELEARLTAKAREGRPPLPNSSSSSSGIAISQFNAECALHFVVNCLSCRDSFGEGQSGEAEDINDADWMSGALTCKAPSGRGSFAPTVDDYSFYDPLQPGAKVEAGPSKLSTSSDYWREKDMPPAKRRAG